MVHYTNIVQDVNQEQVRRCFNTSYAS